MDSAKLNDWMQVIGIFAVVGSLIFVGMQMQQDRRIAVSQSFQSRMDSTIDILIASAENPQFLSASSKSGANNAESITDVESIAMQQYATALLYLIENNHYQYINGFIPEGRWLGSKRTLELMLEENSVLPVRAAFERNPKSWTQEFGDVIRQALSEIDVREGEK